MRAAVITIGCRLNQADSDSLRRLLEDEGHEPVQMRDSEFSGQSRSAAGPNCPELVIINTCCVTGAAERSSVNRIRRVAALTPKPQLVVTGCMADRARRRLEGIPGVDEVWSMAEKAERIRGRIASPARSRALLKVQDGCPNRCAFCVVSTLRGAPVSKPEGQVLAEARRLLADGFREIVLVGLNLGRYGFGTDSSLAGLTSALSRLTSGDDPWRLRLSSIEPETVTGELLDALAGLSSGSSQVSFCPHLHIPLQSGDDRILEAMGRHYRATDFARLVRNLTAVFPDVNLGTDVIAGLPGEDEASFTATRRFLDELPLGYLHVFSYSARAGTPAAKRAHQVGPGVRRERVARLRELGAAKSVAYRSRFLGTTRSSVLIPGTPGSDKDGTACLCVDARRQVRTALTDNYIRLTLREPVPACRQLLPVRIDGIEGTALLGTTATASPSARRESGRA